MMPLLFFILLIKKEQKKTHFFHFRIAFIKNIFIFVNHY